MIEWQVWRAAPSEADHLADLEAKVFVERSWGTKSVKEAFNSAGVHVFLCAGFGILGPVGFSIWRDLGGEAELLSIGVLPAERRRSAANALLKETFSAAQKVGAKKLFLEVDSMNRPALSLYFRNGFKQIGLRQKYYKDGADAVILEKDL